MGNADKRVSNTIKSIINRANNLRRYATSSPDAVVNLFIEDEIKNLIEQDLMRLNPEQMIEDYVEYFEGKNLPTYQVEKDASFYRGRIGYSVLKGSEGDYNCEFILPYHGSNIKAPPPLLSTGARFNREGTSYLYLADNYETCMAEIHMQVGQVCSIGEFKCKKTTQFIDLTNTANDAEIGIWIDILTQPVTTDTKHRYNITRFLAEVLKHINENGLYFNSIQSNGKNIVCYNPEIFELKKYSERTYRAKKISYEFESFTDTIEKYSRRKIYGSLLSVNDNENEFQETEFNLLEEWIEHRKNELENKLC